MICFFQTARAEVEPQGFTFLKNIVGPSETLPLFPKYHVPKVVAGVYFKAVFTAIHDSFQGEKSFVEGKTTWVTWASIKNLGDEIMYFRAKTR